MINQLADIDIKVLRVFCTIVDCGGFTAAQVELNVSASMISTQVSHLETRLGMRLCHRGRGGFSLTDNGRVVYNAAKELFRAMENFRTEVMEESDQLNGELRLGLIETTVTNPHCYLPEAIAALKQRSDRLTLHIETGSTVNLETALLEGHLQLAIGYFHHRVPSLCYQPLFYEDHALYCGAKHPLYQVESEQAVREQLEHEEFADRAYLEVESEKVQTLSAVEATASAPSMEALALLVLSGQYLSFLPKHYAQQWVEQGAMRCLLPGTCQQQVVFHYVTHNGKPPTSVIKAFIEELRSHHQSLDLDAA